VAERTGDAVLAMRSIGDTDVRMANRYLKPREDRIAAVFAEMDEARTAPEATNGKSNETTTTPKAGAVNPLKEDAP
jgi:hypothetical protein